MFQRIQIRNCPAWLAAALLAACGGGGNHGGVVNSLPGETPVAVKGAPAAFGIFDPSLTDDGGTLWMSYSTVNVSPNDPVLTHVSTRIASSTDAGQTWADAGVAPNTNQDELIVPGFPTPSYWTTWQHEVSRLVYDPFDADPNRRWKLLWHRYRTANVSGKAVRLFQHGWMAYSTSTNATGSWSAERKLFVGSGYDGVNDVVIGPPEQNLASRFAGLSNCTAFTEPGLLATAAGVYISLHCAGPGNKIVLLRCTGDFSAGNCTYRGDLLAAGEAQPFAPSGESYTGFSATDLVSAGGKNYLIVSPTAGDDYRGCLVFEIDSLDSATLVRSGGNPVPIRQLGGTASFGFHGACGYASAATASGIIYGKASSQVSPPFRLFNTGLPIP